MAQCANAEMKKRVERYRTLVKQHGHAPTRMTAIFFLFVDPDYQAAMRDGIETTRNYTELITSFVPAAAMEALRQG